MRALPTQQFAESLGLMNAPKIRFVKKKEKVFGSELENIEKAVTQKQAVDWNAVDNAAENSESASASESGSESGSFSEEEEEQEQTNVKAAEKKPFRLIEESDDEDTKKSKKSIPKTKFDALKVKQNQNVFSEVRSKLRSKEESDDESDDEMFKPSKVQLHATLNSAELDQKPEIPMTKTQLKKQPKTVAAALKKHLGSSAQHLVFDEEDNATDVKNALFGIDVNDPKAQHKIVEAAQHGFKDAAEHMGKEDPLDRAAEQMRIKAKKLKRKLKEREARMSRNEDKQGGISLANSDGEAEDDDDEGPGDEVSEKDVSDESDVSDEELVARPGFDEYGNPLDSDEEQNLFSGNSGDDESQEDEPAPRKRKPSKGHRSFDDDEVDSEGKARGKRAKRTIEEDESMARQLLGF